MRHEELVTSVKNVLVRCGVKNPTAYMESAGLPRAVNYAASLAFARCLTEDEDTRQVRWQFVELLDKGQFNLER